MRITPASVFQSLTPDSRAILLCHCLPSYAVAHEIPADLSGVEATDQQRKILGEVLLKVSILGSEEMSFVVRTLLVENGWLEEDFQQSYSGQDRACALLAASEEDFEDAIAIFNGNRLWWREKRESGFQLPDHSLTPEDLDLPEGPIEKESILYGLIRVVLDECMPGKQLVGIQIVKRPSLGLPTDAPEVIQCNISFGEDPVEVEINEDGIERKLSLSFLSRIVVLIDLAGGTLFVGCDSQSKKLRRGLAMAFIQDLLGVGGEPISLSALRVYPEKLNKAPKFVTEPSDRLENVRVSELWYRRFGSPSEVVRSISSSASDTLLYDEPELITGFRDLRIHRAKIEFLFRSYRRKKEPIKKTVTLNNPSGLSYGRAFPQQKLIINRVLHTAGLIDPFVEPTVAATLNDLYRFRTPQHEAEVRSSWPESLVNPMLLEGVLANGPVAETAWCDDCGQTHEVVEGVRDGQICELANCPHEKWPITDDARRTLALNESGLLSWMGRVLETDQQKAAAIGKGCWFLGVRQMGADRGEHGVFLALNWQDTETLISVSRFLEARRRLKRGVVFTIGPEVNPLPLQKGWIVLPLAAVARHSDGAIRLDMDAVEAAVIGRPLKVKRATDEAWGTFFDKYSETRAGLGPYEEAGRMLEHFPKLCPAGRDQLARRLKKEFPDHFSD